MEPDMDLVKNGYHLLDQRALEQKGDAESLFVMADRLIRGIIVSQDEEAGWKLAVRVARLGHPVAVAQCRINGRLTEDHTIEFAVDLLKKCADQGHAIAQYIYANHKISRWDGNGYFLKYSANQNYPPAMISSIQTWRGDPHRWWRDFGDNSWSQSKKDFHIYENAAKYGYWKAAYVIGKCYESGTGVEINKSESIRHYRIAAGKNNARALIRLGQCYKTGMGVNRCKVMGAALTRIGGYAEHMFYVFENLSADELFMVETLTTSARNFIPTDARRAVDLVCSHNPIDAEIIVSFFIFLTCASCGSTQCTKN